MQRRDLPPGVIADIIIPFSSAEEPDWDRLRDEVKTLDQSGVDGISIGGVLGGAIGATPAELSALCGAVKRSSSKPLLAIVFPDVSPEGLEMVRAVDEAGADAILVGQPHYLAQPAPEGLEEMFADFRGLTSGSLLVADCLHGSMVGVKAIQKLAEKRLVDGVLAGADIHILVDLLGLHLEVPVYSGIEDLHYVTLILGARGIISNMAAVFPRDFVELYAAVEDRNHSSARKIHERLVRLWRAANIGTEREARLRSALAARGRNVGAARSPYGRLSPQAGQQIHSVLEKEGVLA